MCSLHLPLSMFAFIFNWQTHLSWRKRFWRILRRHKQIMYTSLSFEVKGWRKIKHWVHRIVNMSLLGKQKPGEGWDLTAIWKLIISTNEYLSKRRTPHHRSWSSWEPWRAWHEKFSTWLSFFSFQAIFSVVSFFTLETRKIRIYFIVFRISSCTYVRQRKRKCVYYICRQKLHLVWETPGDLEYRMGGWHSGRGGPSAGYNAIDSTP